MVAVAHVRPHCIGIAARVQGDGRSLLVRPAIIIAHPDIAPPSAPCWPVGGIDVRGKRVVVAHIRPHRISVATRVHGDRREKT